MQSIWMATHTITVPNPGPLDDTHHDVVVVGAGPAPGRGWFSGLGVARCVAEQGAKGAAHLALA